MAKTLILDVTTGKIKLKNIAGRAIYWGHAADHEGTNGDHGDVNELIAATSANEGDFVAMDIVDGTASGGPIHLGRLLMEIDLRSLPVNAVVTGASLRLVQIQGSVSFNAIAPPPWPVAIYRSLRTIDFATATWRYYASGQEWGRYGLQDGVDYRPIAEASFNAIQNPAAPAGTTFNLDIKNLVSFFAATDSRILQAIIARTDANIRSFPIYANVSGGGGARIGFTNYVGRQPQLTITYVDALSHHPADDGGLIDLTTEIDTTAGGIYLFDPIRVGTFGGAKKFFVKNNMSASAPNLRVISRRSYASLPYEVTRNAAGNGTISDITTVDKSVDNVNYTRTERWKVELLAGDAALNQFHVFHDNGTHDDPGIADAWTAANPATGTFGVAYLEADRKVGFTVTDGGTPFVDGDIPALFDTREDDAHPAVPIDSDQRLEIAPDDGANAPADFRPLVWKPMLVASGVTADTVVPIADTSVFGVGQEVKFYRRADGVLLATRTVDAVAENVSITVSSAVTLSAGDVTIPTPVGVSVLAASGEFPYWLRAWAPAGAVRETKFPRWRAEAD